MADLVVLAAAEVPILPVEVEAGIAVEQVVTK
jgi:hypothetical protein